MNFPKIALEVHANGEVFFEGKKASTQRGPKGYHTVRIPLHRFMAWAFHGKPPTPQHVCHHIDGNPRNNAADNLQWITQSENCRLHMKGKRKLTRQQAMNILAKKPGPAVMLTDLARAWGVTYSTVKHARLGRTWKNGWHKHNRRKLTAQQIQAARDWQPPVITARIMARQYKVSDVTILNIWNGRYVIPEE
jgi:hypothetical protein